MADIHSAEQLRERLHIKYGNRILNALKHQISTSPLDYEHQAKMKRIQNRLKQALVAIHPSPSLMLTHTELKHLDQFLAAFFLALATAEQEVFKREQELLHKKNGGLVCRNKTVRAKNGRVIQRKNRLTLERSSGTEYQTPYTKTELGLPPLCCTEQMSPEFNTFVFGV